MKVQASIITDLIRMDIINCKLVNHFSLMGVELEQYSLGIDEIVFELMDIQHRPDTDEIFERYTEEYKAIMEWDLKYDRTKFELLAKSLYKMLDLYAQQPVAKELPPDTRQQINEGKVSYRDCEIVGLFYLEVHGKEYIVTPETLNWFEQIGAKISLKKM